jgi:hypothetical protein
MAARVALLLLAALSGGAGIGLHADEFDLGFWLMALAGFLGSWAIRPLSKPPPGRAGNRH